MWFLGTVKFEKLCFYVSYSSIPYRLVLVLFFVFGILWDVFWGLRVFQMPGGTALTGKESTSNLGDLGSIPGLGRSPREGKGYPLQYSGLENPLDCIVHGVTKSWKRLSDFHTLTQRQHTAHLGSHRWFAGKPALRPCPHLPLCIKLLLSRTLSPCPRLYQGQLLDS